VKDRKARRMRVLSLTLDSARRQELVNKAVKLAETPKQLAAADFDRTPVVYSGREISPYYFEGEERRIINHEKAYDRDERQHITRFDTIRMFVNPLSVWRQIFNLLPLFN